MSRATLMQLMKDWGNVLGIVLLGLAAIGWVNPISRIAVLESRVTSIDSLRLEIRDLRRELRDQAEQTRSQIDLLRRGFCLQEVDRASRTYLQCPSSDSRP